MPTPSPGPTVYVVMEGQQDAWSNPATTAIVSLLLGAVLTFLVQWMLAGRQARHEISKEDRETRRALYVRVALAFDQINHYLHSWIRTGREGMTGEDPERVEAGAGLAESMNSLTGLATEVEISGHPFLADYLREVTSRENDPSASELITDATPDEWEVFRRRFQHQRQNAVALMRTDLALLSGRLAPWPVRAYQSWRERWSQRRQNGAPDPT